MASFLGGVVFLVFGVAFLLAALFVFVKLNPDGKMQEL
jgi:hypothetical protein